MDNYSELVVVDDAIMGDIVVAPIARAVVVEFGDTLMGIHPHAKDVGLIGMRAVAQIAIATGANPMPGTNGIHVWKDNKGKFCFQLGIGYWRANAARAGGAISWIRKVQPMTDEERVARGIPDTHYGAVCEAALKNTVFGYIREAKE